MGVNQSVGVEAIAARLSDVLGADSVVPWAQVAADRQAQMQAAIASERPPACMVLPDSTEALANAMALANENRWRVLPTGQSSKLSWGGLAEGIEVVIGTERLNQVVEHAVGDFTVTVASGLKVAVLKQLLAKQGQFLAIDPAFADRASVGGVVATADTGSLRARYGGLRDMLIGVQFVRYDGKVAKAGGRVVKNVAGYDLMKLMAGAYGSLGILSELTFRLYPQSVHSRSLILSGTAAAIEQAVAQARLLGLTPVALDVISASFLASLMGKPASPDQQPGQFGLVARFQGVVEGIDEQAERLQKIATMHSLTCQSLDQVADDDFWQRSDRVIRSDTVLCKVGMRPSAIPALLEMLKSIAPDAQARLHGHSGLGWAQFAPDRVSAEELSQLRSHCQQNGGFLTLLQAPKSLKRSIEAWGYTGDALDVMRAIKQKFDPHHSLSPGRFIGGL
ncbi:MAG: FAD-binding oxidoreductase [Phormidesmis sp.]